MDFTYLIQPPNRYTFRAPRVKLWTEQWCVGKVLNLFAGQTILNVDEIRVDIDTDCPADFHEDAYEFVYKLIGNENWNILFDTIILDPPWNYRKAREKYEGRWIGRLTKLKDILPKIMKCDGRVISWGYDTVGMSRMRGFEKLAICIVCHSGDHNDSIGLVERRICS